MLSSFQTLALFFFSFIVLWVGAGIVVSSIALIAKRTQLSSFIVSFFILGAFTSISELMVGINALGNNTPTIFVGNLLGGSIVIFLLIVPLLAVVGNGIKLNHHFSYRDILLILIVVGAPSLLILDNSFDFIDAIICLILYGYLFYTHSKRDISLMQIFWKVLQRRRKLSQDITKVIIGIILVFFASDTIVNQTVVFSEMFGISPFIISLIVISIGTNIPEIALAVRSVALKKKDIAFGDYLGSASLNTPMIGIFTLLNGDSVSLMNRTRWGILLFLVGLIFLAVFARSKNDISRKEGTILLTIYGLFVVLEILFYIILRP